jgi:8-oxo-dGTP diphosphatase
MKQRLSKARSTNRYPKIGVNVVLFRDDLVLLGRRKRCGPEGMWCPPGGHLGWQESVFACAEREVYEETGLTIKRLRLGPFTNDIGTRDGRHFLSLFVIADYASGMVRNGEPQDIKEWEWFHQNALPTPLFYNINNLLSLIPITQLKSWQGALMYDGTIKHDLSDSVSSETA